MAPRRCRACAAFVVILLACLATTNEAAAYRPPLSSWTPPTAALHHRQRSSEHSNDELNDEPDLLSKCKLHWRNATLDHFSWAKPEGHSSGHFLQRVFVCAEHWRPAPNGALGPIFFYLGNEADVTLYLNHTGLMWENAADYGALLVFAEHRYYGQSKPWPGKKLRRHMGYLTAEQALADYAEIITELRTSVPGAAHSPVVGFGGSYGGMLATWMRLKYPHLLHGAIAASAPIWNFFGEEPPFDPLAFAKGVTYDASEAAGSPPGCVDKVRKAWQVIVSLGGSASGRRRLSSAMRLCPDVQLNSLSDVLALRGWLASAWDYMAMGNFPYPSSYMTNGAGDLPAFPVRVACGFMTAEGTGTASSESDTSSSSSNDQELHLMSGLAQAAGILYNFSGTVDCFSPGIGPSPESDEDSNFWDYQWCTEMLMPSARDGVHDLYWPEPFDLQASLAMCRQNWGVQPRRRWATIEWGGRQIASSSNIVFSNGLLDPWHGTGVLESLSDSLVAVIIPEAAHHLDLMFSHPLDPPSVTAARQTELQHISRWIREASQPWQEQRERLDWWEKQQYRKQQLSPQHETRDEQQQQQFAQVLFSKYSHSKQGVVSSATQQRKDGNGGSGVLVAVEPAVLQRWWVRAQMWQQRWLGAGAAARATR